METKLYEIWEEVISPTRVGYSIGTDEVNALRNYKRMHPNHKGVPKMIKERLIVATEVQVPGFKIIVEPLEKRVESS